MNNFKKKIIALSLWLVPIIVSSQSYIGKNDFGCLEFVNDSVCTLSFIDIPGSPRVHIVDTCTFIKSNDTIFLSSKIRKKFDVQQADLFHFNNQCIPILLKVYAKKNNKYILKREIIEGIYYDSISNRAMLHNVYLLKYDLLVFYIYGYYTRMKVYNKMVGNFTIKFNEFWLSQSLFFDSFPIILKGNRLIPVSGINQEKCWINNGFYFPVMKKEKSPKEYNCIYQNKIGLIGLGLRL